jgi:hypothetical protein
MLDPIVSSTVPWQCDPLCPNGSSEEQNGLITRSNCMKHCPGTSSAPTTTAWAPNHAFGLPPGILQRCCGQPRTLQSFASSNQCSALWCASHTPPAPYPRVDISTDDAAPNEVPCHPIHTKMESLEPGQCGHAQDPRLTSIKEDGLHDCLVKFDANSWGCLLLLQHLSDLCLLGVGVERGKRRSKSKRRDGMVNQGVKQTKQLNVPMRMLKIVARARNNGCIHRQIPTMIPTESACATPVPGLQT